METRAVRQQMAVIAATMARGDVDLLEGCRRIVSLRGNLCEPDIDDADLLVLVAVESELDDVPSGEARASWAADALLEKDTEAAEYLDAARSEILRACRALAARWS